MTKKIFSLKLTYTLLLNPFKDKNILPVGNIIEKNHTLRGRNRVNQNRTAGHFVPRYWYIWKLEQHCFCYIFIKGWEPWELSLVFNPDPSQLSFTYIFLKTKGKLNLSYEDIVLPGEPSTWSRSDHYTLSSKYMILEWSLGQSENSLFGIFERT